jgi:hypothetical protein
MDDLKDRVYHIIDICWNSFRAKVGCGLIDINKEASMQLQFAYLLRNSLDLAVYAKDENITLELERGIKVNGKLRECDLLIKVEKGAAKVLIPIEMKCYKTWSTTGGRRGAQDLFRYGLYQDLQLLENYSSENENTALGVQLTMTDNRNFVYPKSKEYKSWAYDISHDSRITDGKLIEVPIGGDKNAYVKLDKNYHFEWTENGSYYFLKIQGT